jgi:quercetin dioxygenase-like cupin family protein
MTATPTMIEDPVLRQRYAFTRANDPDGAPVLLVDLEVDPGGGVTPHVHPALEERFRVVAGTPEFLAGRQWRRAAPGTEVVVPPGIRHAYRNRAQEPARIRCEARPPSSLQEFLEDVAALSRAGLITRHGLPRSPRALLHAALLVERHRALVTLGFPPLPPPFAQRLLFGPLARLGARRGLQSRPR